ncbi:hypothetical protein WMY93_025351 [Mugilogobius chulae]|uniref:Sulfhydryl oxidase n=1 Tax=Mugilogobius chulae TaxID=88201 RepID=A0AAW0NEP3_9GOBI
MRRSKRAEAVIQSTCPNLKVHDVSDELTSAWKSLAQSKAALRQIENKLEAGPGTGVFLESVNAPSKNKSLRKEECKDGQQGDKKQKATKMRRHNSQSPEKSNSRGPLCNSTQDNTAYNSVEFRDPLASYREATPPPLLSSLQSAPGSSHSSQPSNSNPVLGHLVYQRDTKQSDRDSSTKERMEVRYLNDLPGLDTIRTHPRVLTREAVQLHSSSKAQLLQSTDSKESGSTPSTSPGSASQRLENLRRHQPDDKLEKLKERIRKQRQHLEETAEKEKLGSHLEQPLIGSGNCGTCTVPTVKVRKVATAPSAPIYKGFNSTETKIQTPDGKIWHEEDFHNLSREIYKELSQQFAESAKTQIHSGQRGIPKERKPHKPVRKVQKIAPVSDFVKPVISPASWREGQKLVKLVLNKDLTGNNEESQKARRENEKGSHCRSRPASRSDLLSADIKGILDDLQLQCKTTDSGERARATSRRGTSRRQGRGSSDSRTRTPVSMWETTSTRGCRSASPSNRSQAVNRVEAVQKKRHYDADTVRQYIAQQQEKRKRQQVKEKNALREEAEKKQQRLQELYRKQKEVVKTGPPITATPAQTRLQETFNKLLEGTQLREATQMRTMYQPSGESDKENKTLEQDLSPSSSDRSINHLPISRNDIGVARSAHLEYLIPTSPAVVGPVCSNEHLLSQLLRLESAIAASEKQTKRPITAPSHSQDKMSRIEALKATATSLSNRIESEACKLAGEGFNYGLTTSVDVDSILAPRSSQAHGDRCGWNETENEQRAFNTERMSGSRSMYNWTGFPEQDLAFLKMPIEKNKKIKAVEEKTKTDGHRFEAPFAYPNGQDSSGSISEGEHSPPQPVNAFRPIGQQGAVDHSVRKSHKRLSEFQKDAEKCAALNSLPTHQQSSKPAWEEFNKGSPLSVINIFTKNLQENVQVGDMYSEMNSPAHLLPSSSHDLDYEDDFVSTQSSGVGGQVDVNELSSSNHYDELLKRSPKHSSVQSPQCSSSSTPGSSPRSNSKISDQSDATLVEEHRSSPRSEALSTESSKKDFKRSSEHSQGTSDDISGLSHQSSKVIKKMSPPSKLKQSPSESLDQSSLESNSFNEPLTKSSYEKAAKTNTTAHTGQADVKAAGELQYSPAVLQQRVAAQLHYLESIEESVRQLNDIERLMGVSVAQHESASLAQILKAKQQQHEQELYELKIKTEREALEATLQMEENRQRVARAHIELQEGLAATHKETLEGLQEATTKMMSQQAETARYTADTARHIKEMTEIAHTHLKTCIPGSVHTSSQLLGENSYARTRDKASLSYESSRTITDENSSDHSDSESFRGPRLSEPDSNYHRSVSSEYKERRLEPPKENMARAESSISIEDEVHTPENKSLCSDSIPSAVELKGDTTSVATEYSHKFDESITEDEIEEHSFRSLLPSEAHRRESLDRKLPHHDESEEDGACQNGTPALGAHSLHPVVSSAFSGGKDSFSLFTMEMVRQYMRDEEVRLQHQSALLRLRQKALKEKTHTELAWLEHQKKKLRDKGEDDKMPPIKKKQRGLLLKLQQEQAEIKRLQEANKAARKERQLLLKQQEEIERMRSSTLKLKERLRSAATEAPSVSETSLSEVASSNFENADPIARSPSPSVSISGSETSSIMQKLKKMHSQMDEKFLTKREQQLMQRRRHAEELLEWKQRLDQEEAEVCKMEKKALAAWDGQASQNKEHDLSESEKEFNTSQRQKDFTEEVDLSSATPESSIHTDVEVQVKTPAWAKNTSTSEVASIQSSPANYTDDFTSVSPSTNRQSAYKSTIKDSIDASPSEHGDQMSNQRNTTGSPVPKQTEHISDQSDIEGRIRALKEELKKRKFTAYQLKKEQKKRTKERLKAKEANLLKQLETYNDFIEKTKAELNKQPDTTSQITDAVSYNTEHFSDRTTSQRKASEAEIMPILENKALPNQSRSTSINSAISDEDLATVTPTPRPDSSDLSLTSKEPKVQESQNYHATSELDIEMQEELKMENRRLSEDQDSKSLAKFDKENKMDNHLQDDQKRKISPSLTDSYESSIDIPLRENNSNLKPAGEKSLSNSDQTSLKKDVSAWATRTDSHEEEIEEEIAEELSGVSVPSNHSHKCISLLDAHNKEELKPDSRNHSASLTLPVADEMPGFCIGDRVVVSGVQPGTLRFKGSTSFANGFWAGVELDKSEGSNNGTYDGVLYFKCAEKHGIFAPPDKVTHLTDKFEMYTDTTEDDDSFHDDMSEEETQKHQTNQPKSQTEHHFEDGQMFLKELGSGDTTRTGDLEQLDKAVYNSEHREHSLHNGKDIWGFGNVSPPPLIEDNEKVQQSKEAKMEDINLVHESDVELNNQLVISSDLKRDEVLKDKLGSLADKIINNFAKDTVHQFAQLKKSKAKKIHYADQIKRNVFEEVEDVMASSVDQKDGLPFFLSQEKEEMSSPELCNRPESPMLGVSGQEELAKRLAELELSRELDDFGDDQDWFDEDYGLSSRREQQRLKQKEREEEEQAKLGGHFGKTGTVIEGLVPSPGDQQVKTPPRPELPHPMPPKLPEEPAMVVPHSVVEIEKMAHAAALEIWKTCGLDIEGAPALTQQLKPNPSQEYFGEESQSEEQEGVCLRSYKKAVYDLTWEILQDVFAEDPNVDQPQWVKPQRVKSSSFHKIRTAGDIGTIQKFVTTEVLKLYGLAKDQCLRTDWPKMLKFGRKKRDRVDNILVQELHEEESQWINYDEDELFVKIQLADSIFDALLKDTANVLNQIHDKSLHEQKNCAAVQRGRTYHHNTPSMGALLPPVELQPQREGEEEEEEKLSEVLVESCLVQTEVRATARVSSCCLVLWTEKMARGSVRATSRSNTQMQRRRAEVIVFAVFKVFCLFFPAVSEAGGLYTVTDQIILLTPETVESVLVNSTAAIVAEFYASWCGHCIVFSPTYKNLARDIKEWKPAVDLAAIDCADETNRKVCTKYSIRGYPTIRFFNAYSKADSKGQALAASRDVRGLRQAIINKLEKHEEPWPPACPPLEPTSKAEIDSFFETNNVQHLALIFEDSKSYIGREVTLDLLQFENIAVRRVLNTEEALVTKLGVTDFPSCYLYYAGGNFRRLQVKFEARTFYSYALQRLPGVQRSGKQTINITNLKTNSTNEPWRPFNASRVYMADLESALHYSLRVEVSAFPVIKGEALNALKKYISVLTKYFPGRPVVMNSITSVDSWLRNQSGSEISFEAFRAALDNTAQAPDTALPEGVKWVGCQGSQPHFRGYPCAVWMLFHVLTVQAMNSGASDAQEVLVAMRDYVHAFFGCRPCAQHFESMAQESMPEVTSSSAAVLWLWSRHNRVNNRLAGALSEDPYFPKIQWPSPELCPLCHTIKANQDHMWDLDQVLLFLTAYFSNSTILTDYLDDESLILAKQKEKHAFETKKRIEREIQEATTMSPLVFTSYCPRRRRRRGGGRGRRRTG